MGNYCRSQFLKGLILFCLFAISACNAGNDDQLSEQEADDYLRRMVEESLTDKKVLEKIALNKSDSTAALLLAKKETLALPEKKVIASTTLPVKKDSLVKKKSIKTDTTKVKVASVQDSIPKPGKQVPLKALPPKPQPIVKDSLKKDTAILVKKPSKKKKNADIVLKDTVKPAPKVIEPMGQKPAQKPIPVPQMPIIKPDTSGK